MGIIAKQIRTKAANDVRVATFGFASDLGDSGAIFTGSPTVTGSPSGLTIGTPSINGTTLTVDGVSHTAGQAIQVTISGGTAGIQYLLTWTGGTDSSETIERQAILWVR